MSVYDDFFSMLHEDHLDVMDMLNQLREMPSSDYPSREEMFNRLSMMLIPHMRGEEKSFYPVLRKSKATAQDAMEAMEQHHMAELALNELTKMNKEEEFWGPKLAVFRKMIIQHVQDEETRIFTLTRTALTEAQMRDVMNSFQTDKKTQMAKTMAAHKVAGKAP